MTTLRDRYGYVPHAAMVLIEDYGEEFAMSVVSKCGGIKIRAASLSKKNKLYALLPKEDAEKVIDAFRKRSFICIDIPTMHSFRKVRNKHEAIKLREAGKSVWEIAISLGITERYVYDLLRAS